MENIPSAMYYTAIFLAGEWGQVPSNHKTKFLRLQPKPLSSGSGSLKAVCL